MVKKTYSEHAEDALYREVWEDVNNEKTMTFIKKYGKTLVYSAFALFIAVMAIQMWRQHAAANRMAVATAYEVAIGNMDANALSALADNASGATADLALFQSWMMTRDTAKLEKLANDGDSRDFRDLAKIHLAGIRGDEWNAKEFENFMSSALSKSSPFYYNATLMVAQKYLAENDTDTANKFLDKIIGDENAPAVISATAQSLR